MYMKLLQDDIHVSFVEPEGKMFTFSFAGDFILVHNLHCTASKVTSLIVYTVGELNDLTNRSIWSKTTLYLLQAVWVGQGWILPLEKQVCTFFLRSLALRVPIYKNFQSNGAKWRSQNLWLLQ